MKPSLVKRRFLRLLSRRTVRRLDMVLVLSPIPFIVAEEYRAYYLVVMGLRVVIACAVIIVCLEAFRLLRYIRKRKRKTAHRRLV